ncbi:MAG: hypothetical protein ACLFVJ_22610 [Persicimonas sp.]
MTTWRENAQQKKAIVEQAIERLSDYCDRAEVDEEMRGILLDGHRELLGEMDEEIELAKRLDAEGDQ